MTTNVVFGGIGGQGIVTASDIFADAAFLAGFDVKKSDVHGMAQRGGSVSSDVRFGARVFSPMIPAREADILVILDEARIDDSNTAQSCTLKSCLPPFLPCNRSRTSD